MGITTHVLNTAQGTPAGGLWVTLFVQAEGRWKELAKAKTNADGRISDWKTQNFGRGIYRLVFETTPLSSFYPQVTVEFKINSGTEHYHVPLLVSPFGYSTYRGS